MPIIIGTDEAGYGPNLGPLVIAASAWHVPDELAEHDLYDLLSDAIRRDINTDNRLPIADSKQLYKPGGTLANLESALFTVMSLMGDAPTSWRDAFAQLDPLSPTSISDYPWYRDYDEQVPIDVDAEAIAACASALSSALAMKGISVQSLRAALIFPSEFNKHVRQSGSKGALLTERSLALTRDVISTSPPEPTRVYCDKHGGRNRYAAAIQHTWEESWIDVRAEGRAKSEYRFTADNREVTMQFAVGGESHLPSALASMTAKYLRELAMRAFNAFWQQEVADLRPTAGYPVDAKRFKADIAAAQARLGIEDDILWRCK